MPFKSSIIRGPLSSIQTLEVDPEGIHIHGLAGAYVYWTEDHDPRPVLQQTLLEIERMMAEGSGTDHPSNGQS